MRKICYIGMLFIITVSLMCIVSCRKESSANGNLSGKKLSAREWLDHNGGSYSNESIKVLAPSGKVEEGHLDWSGTTQYSYFGKEYVEVPFLFQDKETVLVGKDSNNIGGVSFTVVIRKDSSGNYEGALRTIIYGNTVTNSESREKKIITTESYHLFNGDQSTVWHSTGPNSFKEVTRLTQEQAKAYALQNLNSIATSSKGGSGKIMMAPAPTEDCYETSSTDYIQACWSSEGVGYGGAITCTTVPVTTIDLVCNNIAGGGGAGSGGYTGGGDGLLVVLIPLSNRL